MNETEHLLRFFTFSHLPENLREVSKKYADLAYWTYATIPYGSEQTEALRKLLEAKDCAVRAMLDV